MLLAALDRHLLRCATRIPVPPFFPANTFLGLLLDSGHPEARILPALLIAIFFAFFGYLARGVTKSGALAGIFVAALIYVGLGLGGFVTLFVVFAIAWLTTRIGYSRKRQLGIAESRGGRNAGQVLANVSAAAAFAAIAIFYRGFEFAAVAALAEAAADTASSEVGESLSGHAWLITSLRKVEPGTDGASAFRGQWPECRPGSGLVCRRRDACHGSYGSGWSPRPAFSVPSSTVCSAPLSNVRTD